MSIERYGFKFIPKAIESKLRALPHFEEYMLTHMYDDSTKTTYAPVGAFGVNEEYAVLMMGFDGIGFIQAEGHVYAPFSWIATQFPEFSRNLLKMKEACEQGHVR